MVLGLPLTAVTPATLALLDPVGLFAEVGSDRGMPRKTGSAVQPGLFARPSAPSNPFASGGQYRRSPLI